MFNSDRRKWNVSDNEDIEEMKRFLFNEQIRLDEREREIKKMYSKFEDEKKQFKLEMRSINRKIQMENERIAHEDSVLKKKEEIIESAFRSLDQDRRKLEKEKAKVETEKRFYTRENKEFMAREMSKYSGETMFFKGCVNLLQLRKRYKELLKVYHPDNMTGDNDTIILIGNEYEYMKKKLAGTMQA